LNNHESFAIYFILDIEFCTKHFRDLGTGHTLPFGKDQRPTCFFLTVDKKSRCRRQWRHCYTTKESDRLRRRETCPEWCNIPYESDGCVIDGLCWCQQG